MRGVTTVAQDLRLEIPGRGDHLLQIEAAVAEDLTPENPARA
jgi:hypothetical protein